MITYLLAFLSYSSLFCQNVNSNLLLHYAFDGNTLDSSDNDNHGTNFGGAFTFDRFDNPESAILFDGINDYIEFPNIEDLKPNLPVSFSFWIRYDSEDPQDLDIFNTSFEENRSSGIFFNTQISTSKYGVSFGDGSNTYTSQTRRTYVSDEPIEFGQWHHIALVVNSETDMKIYIDCREFGGSYSGTGGTLFYSNLPGNIGRHDRNLNAPANYFKGAMDDFRYWDRSLNIDEILQLCNDEVLSTTNINDSLEGKTILYPNPNKDILNIKTKINFDRILIYNIQGELVMGQAYSDSIDLISLTSGVYIIQLIKDSIIETKRIILE